MSAALRAYQEQITGTSKVWLQNGVKFAGMENGTLIEVKGNYANFVNKSTGRFQSWFMSTGGNGLVSQAQRQLAASDGMPIKWYFSNEASLNATRSLFAQRGISGIQMVYEPMK